MMLSDQELKNMINSLKDNEFINEKDGMIYCKKCLRRKTLKLDGIEGENPKIVRCKCECELREIQAEKDLKLAYDRAKLYKELQTASLLGQRYENVSFETTDLNRHESFITALNRCKKYCEIADEVLSGGFGIYLVGNSGTGKSHIMACMVNELTKQLHSCLFTNFFEIAKQIKKTFGRSLYNESEFLFKLCDVSFLFIDDLGTERVQKDGEDTWLQEKIYDIINKRYNAKKPTIFSSNLTFRELTENRGIMSKTVDRIFEMSNAVLPIKDTSYRKLEKNIKIPF